ncbi:MAG: hypothetical protein WCB53_11370 [Terriglobales bacterium]
MDADFSIELGHDDPVLDFPWFDPSGKLAYLDLKRHPDLLAKIEEAQNFPELAEFLRAANSPRAAFETAKCDTWTTTELTPEEEIFDSSHKFASYVDLVFSKIEARLSYDLHKQFAANLTALLRRAPKIAASAELCVRRCYFKLPEADIHDEGFYSTLYINGYGKDEAGARKNWSIGLNLASNALLQLSASK